MSLGYLSPLFYINFIGHTVPIVVNICVIWSLLEGCLIGNYTTSSYFYMHQPSYLFTR